MEYFVTSNAKLEQFLFYHAIYYHHIEDGEDCQKRWVYVRTPYLESIVKEFREVQALRKKMRSVG